MPNARDIRQRIKSVKNIQQITKAMEMVAAARLRRVQERARACQTYVDKFREVLENVASHPLNRHHPLFVNRSEEKILYFVVGADKGLAGAYNSNLLREAVTRISATGYAKLMVSGRKARDFLVRRGYAVDKSFIGISDKPFFGDAAKIAGDLTSAYANGEFNQIYVIYTHFYSPMNHCPMMMKMLPLDLPGVIFEAEPEKYVMSRIRRLKEWTHKQEKPEDEDIGSFMELAAAEPEIYETDAVQTESVDDVTVSAEPEQTVCIVEPSPRDVLEHLLPRYIETMVYFALLQSGASELGARMTAMGSATNNAQDIISELVLNYNKVRQAAITREISEIVGGVEALQ